MFWLIKPTNLRSRIWIHYNTESVLFYSSTRIVDAARDTSYERFMEANKHSYIGVKI